MLLLGNTMATDMSLTSLLCQIDSPMIAAFAGTKQLIKLLKELGRTRNQYPILTIGSTRLNAESTHLIVALVLRIHHA